MTFGKSKNIGTEIMSVVTRNYNVEKELTTKRHKATFLGDGNILYLFFEKGFYLFL